MAIIEELGIQATVLVAGLPAPEFADKEYASAAEQFGPNTKQSHSYVQCTENAEFAIKFENSAPSKDMQQWLSHDDHKIAVQVNIDGGKIESQSKYLASRTQPSLTINGISDYANGFKRNFRFTPTSTVDDVSQSRVERDKKLAENLGQIRVCVWRVIDTRKRIPAFQGDSNPLTSQLAQKALKGQAISHGTTLSDAFSIPRCNTTAMFEWHDPENGPLAVFFFKYRSAGDLQTMLIIPRPRSPSPAADEDEDDLKNLSREEIERLARERLKETRGRKRSVKIENGDDVPRASRPYKFVRVEGGKKAIDLTEDDDD